MYSFDANAVIYFLLSISEYFLRLTKVAIGAIRRFKVSDRLDNSPSTVLASRKLHYMIVQGFSDNLLLSQVQHYLLIEVLNE